MKWDHKGHQFDQLGKYFEKTKTIYLYGAVPAAKPLLDQIEFAIAQSNYGDIDVEIVFVDRNEYKRKELFFGKKVISPETFYQQFGVEDNGIVVLCVSEKSSGELWETFRKHKIEKRFHAYTVYEFYRYLSLFIYYRYQRFFLHFIDMFIHSTCNLRCKDCIVQTHRAVMKRRTVTQMHDNIDLLFKNVDFVGIMVFGIADGFLGGIELNESLKYILTRYYDRFQTIEIVTNGTIIPQQSFLNIIQSEKIRIVVDDYRKHVPLAREIYPQVIETLKNYHIRYAGLERDHWDDYRFGQVEYSVDDKLSDKLGKCICHAKGFAFIGYHNQPSRIYSCCQQAINTYLHIVEEVDDDGLDLESSSPIEVIEYLMGYTEKGYLSACTRCNGAFEGVEATHIPVAVQIEGEDHER